MGYDSARFVDEAHPELFCCICRDVLQDAVMASCEHTFCRACIQPILEQQPTCPSCRKEVHGDNLRPVVRMVRNMIDGLRLRCSHTELGCGNVSAVASIAEHEAECAFAPVPCPHPGCELHEIKADPRQSLQRRHLDAHRANCQWRSVDCEYGCGKALPACKLDEHKEICDLKPIPCRQGCGEKTLASEADAHVAKDCANTVVRCLDRCEFECKRGDVEAWERHLQCAPPSHLRRVVNEVVRSKCDVAALSSALQEQAGSLHATKRIAEQALGIAREVQRRRAEANGGCDHSNSNSSNNDNDNDNERAVPRLVEGDAVIRGPDWKWGNQDGGMGKTGTVIAVRDDGVVSVKWTNGDENCYRMGAEGACDLLKATESNMLRCVVDECLNQLGALVPKSAAGCKVSRGRDWKYGNQDGGRGKLGEMLSNPDDNGWVSVKWEATGIVNKYRMGGASQAYDLNVVEGPQIPVEGSFVMLTDKFKSFSDAEHGPLAPLDIGEVVSASSRIKVRAASGKTWYYDIGSVRCIQLRRPTAGDLVTLVSGFEKIMDARGGPLTPGDVTRVVEDDRKTKPLKVVIRGTTWWYPLAALRLCRERDLKVGDFALLRPDVASPEEDGLLFGDIVVVEGVEPDNKGEEGNEESDEESSEESEEEEEEEEEEEGRNDSGSDSDEDQENTGGSEDEKASGEGDKPRSRADQLAIKSLRTGKTFVRSRGDLVWTPTIPYPGDMVTVANDYKRHDDAANGPLKPGDLGELLKNDNTSKPFLVRANGREFWYKAPAVRRVVACNSSAWSGRLEDEEAEHEGSGGVGCPLQ